MAQFIEVGCKDLNENILINTKTIERVYNEGDGCTLLFKDETTLQIKESYNDIKEILIPPMQ